MCAMSTPTKHRALDSITTGRKVAYATMVYRQVVLGEGPRFLRTNFPVKAAGPRAHLSHSPSRASVFRPAHTSRRPLAGESASVQYNH